MKGKIFTVGTMILMGCAPGPSPSGQYGGGPFGPGGPGTGGSSSLSISIAQPPNGMTSGSGGTPYYIKNDVILPLSIYYTDTVSGIVLTSLTVSLTGSGTLSFNAGPISATGSLLLSIPTSAGSDGTKNFLVQASIKNDAGDQAQAGSSFTLTLAQLGAGNAVTGSGSTFSIPINVYLDPSWSYGLGSYDITVNFNTTYLSWVSVSGSSSSSEFSLAPGFTPISAGSYQIYASNTTSSTSPKGLINIANVTFQAAVITGTTQVSFGNITLLDYNSSPIPKTRIQSGSIRVY